MFRNRGGSEIDVSNVELDHSINSFILHDRACQYYWSGEGSASIKTFRGGTATYRLDHGTERIHPGQYLLLNDDQEYEITIDSNQEVESFCVFFPKGLARRIANELMMSVDSRLDEPFIEGKDQWNFLDRVYSTDRHVISRIEHIRNYKLLVHTEKLWIDEQISLLLEDLIGLQRRVENASQSIQAIRRATRDELLRRVLTAHEWIRAYYHEDITLDKLARASTLSPNHLIRSYRQVFGVTPHQHVVELRLREAAHLLQNTELTILAICSAVGFSSPSTFSGLFLRRTGCSPTVFRQGLQIGDFQEDSSLSLIYTNFKREGGKPWNP